MKYNNFKLVAKISILYGFLLIVSIVMFAFSYFEPSHKNIYLVLASLSLIIYVFLLLIKPHFFSIQKVKNILEIRFYNPHPFFSNYRMIKIPLEEFNGYEIHRTIFGPRIIFKIKKGKRQGKYPPISISAVSKKDKLALKDFLDNLKSKK